jgi:hypothetical protein
VALPNVNTAGCPAPHFLSRRKSDFFTEKGTDAAMEKMNEIMKQHVDIVIKSQQEEAKKKAADDKKKAVKAKAKAAALEKKAEPVVEMTDGAFDISEVAAAPTPVVAAPVAAAAAVAAPPVATAKAVLTKEISMTEKDDDDDKKEKPIGNGGAVPERYVWTQTLSEVNVVVTVPENTRGRDLNVTITKNHLKVGLRSQPKNTYKCLSHQISHLLVLAREDGSAAINHKRATPLVDSVCQDDPD